MAGLPDYTTTDALGLAALVRNGSVTPSELLEAAIARMEAVDLRLNAVVLRHLDEARASIAAGLPQGPFTGVPFLLKDLYAALKGTVTTNGSRFYRDVVADHDATLVERYRAAGLVIFGKTASPEFGATCATEPLLWGPCRNPWNLDLTPGGSSGGAAAAVAAGIVPAAHATDGGGSIRIPASCCGLFGLKPSRGRMPAGPKRGEGWAGLSAPHVVSWSVRDSAALLDATAGLAPDDPYTAPHQPRSYLDALAAPPPVLRIAVRYDPPNGAPLHPDCRKAVEDAVRLCERLGHRVEEAAPAVDDAALRDAQAKIVAASTAAALKERALELGREPTADDVEHINLLMAQMGAALTAPDYLRAISAVHTAGRQVGDFFTRYDAYLTPTMAAPPLPVGRLALSRTDIAGWMADLAPAIAFTALANQTGCPAMSLPLGMSGNGVPVGVMVMGPFGAEEMLLRLAAQIETAAPWAHRRPPL